MQVALDIDRETEIKQRAVQVFSLTQITRRVPSRCKLPILWRHPLRSEKDLQVERGAQSGADTCPASNVADHLPQACMGYADRVHFASRAHGGRPNSDFPDPVSLTVAAFHLTSYPADQRGARGSGAKSVFDANRQCLTC